MKTNLEEEKRNSGWIISSLSQKKRNTYTSYFILKKEYFLFYYLEIWIHYISFCNMKGKDHRITERNSKMI